MFVVVYVLWKVDSETEVSSTMLLERVFGITFMDGEVVGLGREESRAVMRF